MPVGISSGAHRSGGEMPRRVSYFIWDEKRRVGKHTARTRGIRPLPYPGRDIPILIRDVKATCKQRRLDIGDERNQLILEAISISKRLTSALGNLSRERNTSVPNRIIQLHEVVARLHDCEDEHVAMWTKFHMVFQTPLSRRQEAQHPELSKDGYRFNGTLSGPWNALVLREVSLLLLGQISRTTF